MIQHVSAVFNIQLVMCLYKHSTNSVLWGGEVGR